METQYTARQRPEAESPFAEEVLTRMKKGRGRCLPCRTSGTEAEWEDTAGPAEMEEEPMHSEEEGENFEDGERITTMEDLTDEGGETSRDEGEEPLGEEEDISPYVKEVLPKRLSLKEEEFEEAPQGPRGLMLLDHFHTVRTPDPARPGAFISGGTKTMEPGGMNPLFVDANDSLKTDTSAAGLQTRLVSLLVSKYTNFLSRSSVQNRRASRDDRIRVGLVNLTGERLTQPDFAGWGSTAAMYGASVPKIMGLYSAHQLRSDLRGIARVESITRGPDLERAAIRAWGAKRLTRGLPDTEWYFGIRNWSGSPESLNFTAQARGMFREIMHNCPAGEIIRRVGFPYIASVAWQSGLWHPSRGGLWLSGSYCKKGSWAGNPVSRPAPLHSHNVTALSAATYFTLLAQGRLVDALTSSEIADWLKGGCITGLFPDELPVVASKCGIYSSFAHDCALIENGGLRYVLVVLSSLKRNEFGRYTQLCRDLDALIRESR